MYDSRRFWYRKSLQLSGIVDYGISGPPYGCKRSKKIRPILLMVSTDPTNTASKTVKSSYTYDPQGNVLTEYRSGAGGMGGVNLVHTYDALNRLTGTTGDKGYAAHSYEYDSLGNLVYSKESRKQ